MAPACPGVLPQQGITVSTVEAAARHVSWQTLPITVRAIGVCRCSCAVAAPNGSGGRRESPLTGHVVAVLLSGYPTGRRPPPKASTNGARLTPFWDGFVWGLWA